MEPGNLYSTRPRGGKCELGSTPHFSFSRQVLTLMSVDPQQVNGQPSLIEKIKAQSNYLRGKIAEELSQPTDHFTTDTAQLLKHHGMYQQDDRDRRVLLGDLGVKKQKIYEFMVRTGVPGGRLTSQQLLAHLELADKFGNGTRADHQPARLANARPGQAGPPRGAQADPRNRPDHDGHLRRRASQRRLLPGPLPQRSGSRTDPVDGRADCRGPLAADAGLSRDLARRPAGCSAPRSPSARSSRSTARPICRGSSKWASACPATTARTSIARTSACWPCAATTT